MFVKTSISVVMHLHLEVPNERNGWSLIVNMRRKYTDISFKVEEIRDDNSFNFKIILDEPVNVTKDDKLRIINKDGRVKVRLGKAIEK